MSKSEHWPINKIKKVVIAKDYGDFIKWWNTTEYTREEVFYLATYNMALDQRYPDMAISKDGLVYVDGYEENMNWLDFKKNYLPKYIKMWKANANKEKVLEMK